MTLTLQVADQCGQVEFVEISITTDCGDYGRWTALWLI